MTQPPANILIIDDDEQIRRSLRAFLTVKQYAVRLAESGEDGLRLAADAMPDLVILDMGLPGMHGLEVCKTLRAWYRGPIIVLSGHEAEQDKISALDLGADDYVMKPCALGELLARIRAHLRRMADRVAAPPVYRVGSLAVDIARRRVVIGVEEVALTPIEFEIISLLARNADCVVTYRQLMQDVWHEEFYGDTKAISVHVSNLRKKIESRLEGPPYILNEHGVGFRLVNA